MITSPGGSAVGLFSFSALAFPQLFKSESATNRNRQSEIGSWFDSFRMLEFDNTKVVTSDGIHPRKLRVHSKALGVDEPSAGRSHPACKPYG